MSKVDQLEKLLAAGQDNALLRFGLGKAYLEQENLEQAITHFARATDFDMNYTAAWKLYAKSLAQQGELAKAKTAYQKGIDVANNNGNIQAAKEMQVFLNRLSD